MITDNRLTRSHPRRYSSEVPVNHEPRMSSSPTPPRDFRQEVTDTIIRLLEEGTAPWQKPWDATGSLAMPMNPTSGKAYRGGNAMYLLAIGIKRGYSDPRWMTYRQAQENDWQVRKGEKSTQIEFWDVKRVTTGEPEPGQPDEDNATPEEKQSRLIHRVYNVFNASQIDGLPPFKAKEHTPFEAAEAGERILAHSGAVIHHDQVDRAYYSRSSDEIHLPKREFFPDAPGYYGTALHELAHWTGHPSRLDRPTLTQSYKFGDQNYAKEELRAELASVFLAAERGIPHQPERHAAYVGNWLQALRQDKNEIFRAAADAAKATDFLLDLERNPRITQEAQPEPVSNRNIGGVTIDAAPEAAPASHAERIRNERNLMLDLDCAAHVERINEQNLMLGLDLASHAERIKEQNLMLDLDFGPGR